MADIGAFLEVDFMIYGKLEPRGGGFAASLDLMDVAKRFNRRAAVVPVSADPRGAAKDAFAKLAGSW